MCYDIGMGLCLSLGAACLVDMMEPSTHKSSGSNYINKEVEMVDVLTSLFRIAVNIGISVVGSYVANFIERYLQRRKKGKKCRHIHPR